MRPSWLDSVFHALLLAHPLSAAEPVCSAGAPGKLQRAMGVATSSAVCSQHVARGSDWKVPIRAARFIFIFPLRWCSDMVRCCSLLHLGI